LSKPAVGLSQLTREIRLETHHQLQFQTPAGRSWRHLARPRPVSTTDAQQPVPHLPDQPATGRRCSGPRRLRIVPTGPANYLTIEPLTSHLPADPPRVSRPFFDASPTCVRGLSPQFPRRGLAGRLLSAWTSPWYRPGSRLRGDLTHKPRGTSSSDLPAAPMGSKQALRRQLGERVAAGLIAISKVAYPTFPKPPRQPS
jgi:hypothetical protein